MSGLASVVMSPVSRVLEIAASTRRMILPDRVLGMSGTIQTFLRPRDLADHRLDRGDHLVLDLLGRLQMLASGRCRSPARGP